MILRSPPMGTHVLDRLASSDSALATKTWSVPSASRLRRACRAAPHLVCCPATLRDRPWATASRKSSRAPATPARPASATARAWPRTRRASTRSAAIDELNSTLGLLLSEPLPDDVARCLTSVQHDLFDLGGELSIPGHAAVTEAHVARLEEAVERFNADLGPAEGVHPAGRNPRGGDRARRAHGVPPGRAHAGPHGRHRARQRPGAPVRQPAVGPAVRSRPDAEPRGGRTDVLWRKDRAGDDAK